MGSPRYDAPGVSIIKTGDNELHLEFSVAIAAQPNMASSLRLRLRSRLVICSEQPHLRGSSRLGSPHSFIRAAEPAAGIAVPSTELGLGRVISWQCNKNKLNRCGCSVPA